jgi:3D domain
MTPGMRPAKILAAALPLVALALVAWGRAHGAALVASGCPPYRPPPPSRETLITGPRWLSRTVVTEYYPVPERWFVGRLVQAPGLAGRHRVDWLYGAAGLAMEGQGVGRDGRLYHFAGPYGQPWVNADGKRTRPCLAGPWTRGRPSWLGFGWRNRSGQVTFPLAGGGWSEGPAARYLAPPDDLRFAPGPSRPVAFWRTVAVDRKLIPFGSRVFVRDYCDTPSRGWFVAGDTGSAIRGHHIDVYRPAPASADDARMLTGRRIFVVPPRSKLRRRPSCS